MSASLVGSEMCIRDRIGLRVSQSAAWSDGFRTSTPPQGPNTRRLSAGEPRGSLRPMNVETDPRPAWQRRGA
eukprot:6563904-Alexandrium_andersonii.AAC.1